MNSPHPKCPVCKNAHAMGDRHVWGDAKPVKTEAPVGAVAMNELKTLETAPISQAKMDVEVIGPEREQPVMESVSRLDARRSASATSETMDATAGETASDLPKKKTRAKFVDRSDCLKCEERRVRNMEAVRKHRYKDKGGYPGGMP